MVSFDTFEPNAEKMFSPRGRLNRWPFFLRVIASNFLMFFISYAVDTTIIINDLIYTALLIGYLIIWCIWIVFIAIQAIKRFHDLNKPALSAAILIVPIILQEFIWGAQILTLIIIVLLYIVDGTIGPNKYGNDPKGRVYEDENTKTFEEKLYEETENINEENRQ